MEQFILFFSSSGMWNTAFEGGKGGKELDGMGWVGRHDEREGRGLLNVL